MEVEFGTILGLQVYCMKTTQLREMGLCTVGVVGGVSSTISRSSSCSVAIVLCYADNSVILFPMVNLHKAMTCLVNIN